MICRVFLLAFYCTISICRVGAQEITDDLAPFEKIVIGPKINLELIKGESEHIDITYHGIEEDRINYEVVHGKLRIYLDDARYVEKSIRWNDRHWDKQKMYEGVEVKARVTYKTLEALDIRGEEFVLVENVIASLKFSLQIYGESEVYLEGMESSLFKAHLYGEPNLTIASGFSEEQVFRVYGEATVICDNFRGDWIRTTSFGDSDLSLNGEEIKITALGDAKISYVGNPIIRKSLVLGDLSMVKRD